MKLAKFKTKENSKKYILISLVPVIIIGLILVVFSYSFYQKEDEWEFVNGVVGEFHTSNIYGVKRAIDTSESTWERIGASIELEANAQIGTTEVVNDFDNIYPWSDIKSYNYDTSTQTITAWYGEDNFTFTPTDATTEVLTYIPEFYYKRIQEDGYEYINITKDAKEGFTKSESFSVGRYTMSGSSSRVHSRSGWTPLTNTTITEFRTYARNLGEGFQLLDYHYFILQLLYLVEYADYNSQAKLGLGVSNRESLGGGGGCNALGMKSGTLNNNGTSSMIYRGIENIYSNIFRFVDGINIKDNQVYINYNPSTYEVDKFDGDYKSIGYIKGNMDGYISKLGYDVDNPLIALPIEAQGNYFTYIPDNYTQSLGNRIVLVGGRWNDTTRCGLWYWLTHCGSSVSYLEFGARLLKTH